MAQPPTDINAILAALGQQNQNRAPSGQGQANAVQSPTVANGFSAPGTNLPAPNSSGTVTLPPPSSAGNFDLNAIKPVSTGNVSIADAIAKAQATAADRSASYSSVYAPYGIDHAVDRPSSSYRNRSRSPRRDNYADGYNPYRDERRGDHRRGGGRDRSVSPGRRGRGKEEPADSDVIQVDSNAVGLIIGRGGENMRRIEADSGARVQFITGPEGAGAKRSCRVSGNPRQRSAAIAAIYQTQAENHSKQPGPASPPPPQPRPASVMPTNNLPPLREGERNSQIMVPDKTVGLIIGRRGETIQDLQDRSGCHVNITSENKSVGGYRPVNLIGTQQAAARAREMIYEIVDSDQRQNSQGGSGSSNDHGGGSAEPSRFASSAPAPNYGPSQYANAPFDPYGTSAPKETENIIVPSEAVGMIIGKGGETIKDMQNVSGCKVNVSQPQGADIERSIELIGSRPAIEHARRLINEKVVAVRDKQGGGSGGSGGGGGGGSRGGQNPPPPSSYGYGSSSMPGYSQPMPSMPLPHQGDNADPYARFGGAQNYWSLWNNAANSGSYGGPPAAP
ncbi:MAG: hypothetical protein Q9162_000556 [Coniocarpon cinnabarinum]